MQVYLIRHTRPDVPAGRCYGQADVPLAASAAADIAAVCAGLAPQRPPERIYTSPLQRCQRLAEALAQAHGADPRDGAGIVVDPRLLELHFGAWELRDWDDIEVAALRHWGDDFVHRRPPGGECLADLHGRVGEFIDGLRGAGDRVVAAVSHAGVIRSAWAHLLDIPLANVFRLEIGYGAVLRLVLDPDPSRCSIRPLGAGCGV